MSYSNLFKIKVWQTVVESCLYFTYSSNVFGEWISRYIGFKYLMASFGVAGVILSVSRTMMLLCMKKLSFSSFAWYQNKHIEWDNKILNRGLNKKTQTIKWLVQMTSSSLCVYYTIATAAVNRSCNNKHNSFS